MVPSWGCRGPVYFTGEVDLFRHGLWAEKAACKGWILIACWQRLSEQKRLVLNLFVCDFVCLGQEVHVGSLANQITFTDEPDFWAFQGLSTCSRPRSWNLLLLLETSSLCSTVAWKVYNIADVLRWYFDLLKFWGTPGIWVGCLILVRWCAVRVVAFSVRARMQKHLTQNLAIVYEVRLNTLTCKSQHTAYQMKSLVTWDQRWNVKSVRIQFDLLLWDFLPVLSSGWLLLWFVEESRHSRCCVWGGAAMARLFMTRICMLNFATLCTVV